ncbi:MAG: hypothetical protein ACFFAD_14625 [Candidatus Hermodarchaeota archaeon]
MKAKGLIGISFAIIVLLLVTTPITASENGETYIARLLPSLARDSSALPSTLIEESNSPRIAVVKPIFTATAYSYAFYQFYSKYISSTQPFITTDLHYLNVTVKDGWGWSNRLNKFLSSFKAESAGLSLGETFALIDEIDVLNGALFNEEERVYDVVILGFTEYVTLEEYYYYKRFVETGGTLIIMDACNFLAEVKYYPPTTPGEPGYLSLVKGHGWEFNGTHAWKSVYHRWPEENRNWIGSNYWRWWTGKHYDFFQANTTHPISVYIRNSYGPETNTHYKGHEENKLENLTGTEIIGYWHFINPEEAPTDPVVAYQHRYRNGSVFHTGIMASDVIDIQEFLQAFLISAVRMGLYGEVGDWTFWEDSSFESSTKMLYENGTQIPQEGCISGVITFLVTFDTNIIARNQKPYLLSDVHVRIYHLDSNSSSESTTVAGRILRRNPLNWSIEINTCNLTDARYVFEIGCRFIFSSDELDYVDSILMVAIHEVDNIDDDVVDSTDDEILKGFYLTLGSLGTVLAFICVYIVLSSRVTPNPG